MISVSRLRPFAHLEAFLIGIGLVVAVACGGKEATPVSPSSERGGFNIT
jgi:hypothetical protein